MNRQNQDVTGLASYLCERCQGSGVRTTRTGVVDTDAPCRCVLQSIFSACHEQFRACAARPRQLSMTTYERSAGTGMRRVWGRSGEEYIADFTLTSKRALGAGSIEYRLFAAHFLLGADPTLACRQLGLTRETFDSLRTKVVQVLGRAFSETEPYALYPPVAYFASSQSCRALSSVPPVSVTFQPVQPPMAQAVL